MSPKSGNSRIRNSYGGMWSRKNISGIDVGFKKATVRTPVRKCYNLKWWGGLRALLAWVLYSGELETSTFKRAEIGTNLPADNMAGTYGRSVFILDRLNLSNVKGD